MYLDSHNSCFFADSGLKKTLLFGDGFFCVGSRSRQNYLYRSKDLIFFSEMGKMTNAVHFFFIFLHRLYK